MLKKNKKLFILLLFLYGCPSEQKGVALAPQAVNQAVIQPGMNSQEIFQAFEKGAQVAGVESMDSLSSAKGEYQKSWDQYYHQQLSSDSPKCIPILWPDNIDSELVSKTVREAKLGGGRCECQPMTDSCSQKKVCLCSELCPDNYSIFKGRRKQMDPSPENTFPFRNSSALNDSVFKKYPIKNGVCLGHSMMERKFNTLGHFLPNATYNPLTNEKIPKKDDPDYVKYILGQIHLIASGSPAVFPMANLGELAGQAVFQEAIGEHISLDQAYYNALAQKKGTEFNDIDDWEKIYEPNDQSQSKALFNELNKRLPLLKGDHLLTKPGGPIKIDSYYFPKHIANEVATPPLQEKYWNQEGPWETIPLNFYQKSPRYNEKKIIYQNCQKEKKDCEKERAAMEEECFGHAISVYGKITDDKGNTYFCVRDPNHLSKELYAAGNSDENCNNRMQVTKDDQGGYNFHYNGKPLFEKSAEDYSMGKIFIPKFDQLQKGLWAKKLTQSCKLIYKDQFFFNDCPQ